MLEQFERRQIETGGGIAINCAIAGSGPPVLLLHGSRQNHLAMWAAPPLLVRAGFSAVCADLRGYGDSSKPRCLTDRSNYTFRAMAVDQVALMGQLGFSRFHMGGHDRGGRTGNRMALRSAERSPVARGTRHRADLRHVRGHQSARRGRLLALVLPAPAGAFPRARHRQRPRPVLRSLPRRVRRDPGSGLRFGDPGRLGFLARVSRNFAH